VEILIPTRRLFQTLCTAKAVLPKSAISKHACFEYSSRHWAMDGVNEAFFNLLAGFVTKYRSHIK